MIYSTRPENWAIGRISSQTESFRLTTVKFRVEQPETHRNTEKKTAGLWGKQGNSYLYVKTAHFHMPVLCTDQSTQKSYFRLRAPPPKTLANQNILVQSWWNFWCSILIYIPGVRDRENSRDATGCPIILIFPSLNFQAGYCTIWLWINCRCRLNFVYLEHYTILAYPSYLIFTK